VFVVVIVLWHHEVPVTETFNSLDACVETGLKIMSVAPLQRHRVKISFECRAGLAV
jgi:hypothetical protein